MHFEELLIRIATDTFDVSLPLCAPEFILAATMLALLLGRLLGWESRLPGGWLVWWGATLALVVAGADLWHLRAPAETAANPQQVTVASSGESSPAATGSAASGSAAAGSGATGTGTNSLGAIGSGATGKSAPVSRAAGSRPFGRSAMGTGAEIPLFGGLIVWDPLTVFARALLLLILWIVLVMSLVGGVPDREDAPDFHTLLLGATVGLLLMASANHWLLAFLAMEMASIPSYALVGFLKGRRSTSEAALKYIVYGSGAAGVTLYGISLLCGLLGTASFSAIPEALTAWGNVSPDLRDARVATLVLGLLFVFVGLAFKLAIFPFHFWCPDAFEGASAEVAGFLSVASKVATLALLARICLALVSPGPEGAAIAAGVHPPHLGLKLAPHLGVGLGLIAAAAATFGNLAAYSQNNIKRMLAYSTIAQAGYMLMALAALLVLAAGVATESSAFDRLAGSAMSLEALFYYLVVYAFMNLAAFALAAILRNATFSERISDYSGLATQSPLLAVGWLVCLFSLVGLPPFGGFVAKFWILAAVFEAGRGQSVLYAVVLVGALNTVLSLFYYVRVLKFIYLRPVLEGVRPVRFAANSAGGALVVGLCLPILLTGICVDPLSRLLRHLARLLVP